jgi:hypothetical protein
MIQPGASYNTTVSVPQADGSNFTCRYAWRTAPSSTAATAAAAPTESERFLTHLSASPTDGEAGVFQAPPTAEAYALVAASGAWFGGGLPARSCSIYRIPPSNIPAAGGLAAWTAWGEGGPPLYRTPNATEGGVIDMSGTVLVF